MLQPAWPAGIRTRPEPETATKMTAQRLYPSPLLSRRASLPSPPPSPSLTLDCCNPIPEPQRTHQRACGFPPDKPRDACQDQHTSHSRLLTRRSIDGAVLPCTWQCRPCTSPTAALAPAPHHTLTLSPLYCPPPLPPPLPTTTLRIDPHPHPAHRSPASSVEAKTQQSAWLFWQAVRSGPRGEDGTDHAESEGGEVRLGANFLNMVLQLPLRVVLAPPDPGVSTNRSSRPVPP